MKKLSLLGAALLFAAGIGFAQNTSTVTQTGDNQVADVIQFGSNTAVVTQIESESPATFPLWYFNKATVWQDGVGNLATIYQVESGTGDKVENRADIVQLGYDNISLQITVAPEFNSDLDVKAWQEGIGNNVYQDIRGGYTDYFYTYQLGNYNKATQLGTGITHNTASIYQFDSNNTATQNLFGGNNGYYGGVYDNERILIEQHGTWNNATQTFIGEEEFGHGNTADIYQNGWKNYANQYGTGINLYADFTQIGDNNSATSSQDGSLLQVFVYQIGHDNLSTSTQIGINNLATINQTN